MKMKNRFFYWEVPGDPSPTVTLRNGDGFRRPDVVIEEIEDRIISAASSARIPILDGPIDVYAVAAVTIPVHWRASKRSALIGEWRSNHPHNQDIKDMICRVVKRRNQKARIATARLDVIYGWEPRLRIYVRCADEVESVA